MLKLLKIRAGEAEPGLQHPQAGHPSLFFQTKPCAQESAVLGTGEGVRILSTVSRGQRAGPP